MTIELQPEPVEETVPASATAGLKGLADASYCLITSFRKSGQGVETPVWFALDDGVAYVKTGVDSGKVKRIRRESRIEVAPCTLRGRPRGAAVLARARVVTDPAEEERAERALAARYGLVRRVFLASLHLFGVDELYVAIEPGS
jgi:PPOX class probable F420-dependent enzyme